MLSPKQILFSCRPLACLWAGKGLLRVGVFFASYDVDCKINALFFNIVSAFVAKNLDDGCIFGRIFKVCSRFMAYILAVYCCLLGCLLFASYFIVYLLDILYIFDFCNE